MISYFNSATNTKTPTGLFFRLKSGVFMELQHILDWVFAAAGAIGGWMLKSLWEAVKDLQTADKQLAEKVNSIEVLVAGEYATRSDFQVLSTAIFAKLDRIEDKLDAKVDK